MPPVPAGKATLRTPEDMAKTVLRNVHWTGTLPINPVQIARGIPDAYRYPRQQLAF